MNSHSTSVSCSRATHEDLPDQSSPRERISQIDHNPVRALGGSAADDFHVIDRVFIGDRRMSPVVRLT